MGEDIPGIERGKCAFGDYDNFMRSAGATCGYCGCFLPRHSKKNARFSSDYVLRHQEDGTSGSGTSGSGGERAIIICTFPIMRLLLKGRKLRDRSFFIR